MTRKAQVAYIGVGANLGDPVQQIVDARSPLLALESTTAARCSSLYVSSPVGYRKQPDFINCVIELSTSLAAHELLLQMQRIEASMGRLRDLNNRNAPRMIDLDLLLFGDACIEDDLLTVPHPRMVERLFVMKPLLELAPSIIIPGFGAASVYLQRDFGSQILHRLTL